MTQSQRDALIARITRDPEIFGEKPIVGGKRIAVEHILSDLGVGESLEAILANFPFLEPEDIQACLLFASEEVGHLWLEHHPALDSRAFVV